MKELKNITDLNNNENSLVLLSTEWCGPCRMLKPVIDKISNDGLYSDISFYQLDIGDHTKDINKTIIDNFKVTGVPTLIFFKRGEEVYRCSGVKTRENIETNLNKLKSYSKR